MGDIEFVIKWSKKFEAELENSFGATGRGLHEKLSSVENQFPEPLVKKLRYTPPVGD